MNMQRTEVYRWRREILEGKETRDYVQQKVSEILEWLLSTYAAENTDPNEWQVDELKGQLVHYYNMKLSSGDPDFSKVKFFELRDTLAARLVSKYEEKERLIGPEMMRRHE